MKTHTGSASLGQPLSTGHLDALALRDWSPDGKADIQRQLAHCVVRKQTGQLAKWGTWNFSKTAVIMREREHQGRETETQKQAGILLTWDISPKNTKEGKPEFC